QTRVPRRLAGPARQGGRARRVLPRGNAQLRIRSAGPRLRADRAVAGAFVEARLVPGLEQTRKLVYSMSVSLDGFIAGPGGDIDWSAPDEELHRFHNQQMRETGVELCG